MKLTTVMMIGVFTLGSASVMADHKHRDHDGWKHRNHENHQARKHHRKAEHHERKARKHERKARRHERMAHREYRDDSWGRVTHVEPVYRSVRVPVRDDSCIEHRRDRPRHNSYTGTVLGAVIGGALGHRIGDAHGDADAAAIAGGLLGATVGHNIDRNVSYNRNVRVEGPCRVKRQRYESRRELVEYKVSYRYNGEVHRTRMDYDPGEWIKLDVDVSPA